MAMRKDKRKKRGRRKNKDVDNCEMVKEACCWQIRHSVGRDRENEDIEREIHFNRPTGKKQKEIKNKGGQKVKKKREELQLVRKNKKKLKYSYKKISLVQFDTI